MTNATKLLETILKLPVDMNGSLSMSTFIHGFVIIITFRQTDAIAIESCKRKANISSIKTTRFSLVGNCRRHYEMLGYARADHVDFMYKGIYFRKLMKDLDRDIVNILVYTKNVEQ